MRRDQQSNPAEQSDLSSEEIIRELEQFPVEVLQAALDILKSRRAATKSRAPGQETETEIV